MAPSLGEAVPRLCSSLLLSLVVASSASAVTMSWTPIGNPGNACDPQSQGFDQGGNVFEWNETIFGPEGRGIRGGDFAAGSPGNLDAGSRFSLVATDESQNVGFRVAPEPGRITLLAAGLLGVLGLARVRRMRA